MTRMFFITILLATALSGCTNPHDRELPALSDDIRKNSESLSSGLSPAEKEVFLRWADRMTTSERYIGENIPTNVRMAIANQTRYEAMSHEKKIIEDKKIAEEKNKLQQEEQKLKRIELASDQIKKYFIVKGVSYDWTPIFDSNGLEAYREWQFDLILSNLSNKEIIGAKGFVQFKDAFGKEIGIYPVRIENSVKPGKSVDYILRMTYDPNTKGHLELFSTETLFMDWFFVSLAFVDGTRLDYESIEDSSGQTDKSFM